MAWNYVNGHVIEKYPIAHYGIQNASLPTWWCLFAETMEFLHELLFVGIGEVLDELWFIKVIEFLAMQELILHRSCWVSTCIHCSWKLLNFYMSYWLIFVCQSEEENVGWSMCRVIKWTKAYNLCSTDKGMWFLCKAQRIVFLSVGREVCSCLNERGVILMVSLLPIWCYMIELLCLSSFTGTLICWVLVSTSHFWLVIKGAVGIHKYYVIYLS